MEKVAGSCQKRVLSLCEPTKLRLIDRFNQVVFRRGRQFLEEVSIVSAF